MGEQDISEGVSLPDGAVLERPAIVLRDDSSRIQESGSAARCLNWPLVPKSFDAGLRDAEAGRLTSLDATLEQPPCGP
jgi:hypothetical protein